MLSWFSWSPNLPMALNRDLSLFLLLFKQNCTIRFYFSSCESLRNSPTLDDRCLLPLLGWPLQPGLFLMTLIRGDTFAVPVLLYR